MTLSPKFQRLLWLLGLAAAGILGLYGMSAPGTTDIANHWLRWIRIMQEYGVVEGYARAVSDYTPLSFIFLSSVAGIAQLLGVGNFIVLKAGVTLFSWLSTALFWHWTRHRIATVVLLLGLVLSSSALGYLDVLYLPPLFLCLRALQQTRLSTAAFWFSVAISFKWQPLLIAPVLLLAGWKLVALQSNVSPARYAGRLLLGAAPVAIALIAGFGAGPLWQSLHKGLTHPALSYQGLNLPWLVQWLLAESRLPGNIAPFFLRPPAGALLACKTLFFGAYAFGLFWFWRHGRTFNDFLRCACLAAFTYFALNTGVHENHLFMAMILALAVYALRERVGRTMAVHCVLAANLNLIVFYGLDGLHPALGGGRGLIAGTLCVLNLAFLAAGFFSLVKSTRATGKIAAAP